MSVAILLVARQEAVSRMVKDDECSENAARDESWDSRRVRD